MQDQEYHESFMPPTPIAEPLPQQTIVSDATLGHIALLANVAVTTIIIVAMLVDGSQARTAIISGGLYFMFSTFIFAGITTGALTAIVNAWQRERTERERIRAYLALGTQAMHWRLAVERNRIGDMSPILGDASPPYPRADAEGVQRVSPLTTFVAPYADEQQAAREGVAWAEKLYDRTAPHAPDGRKVLLAGESAGRLRVRMIGSKRGGGSRESGVWLLRQGIIRKVAGGYALSIDQFPYRHYVSAIRPQ